MPANGRWDLIRRLKVKEQTTFPSAVVKNKYKCTSTQNIPKGVQCDKFIITVIIITTCLEPSPYAVLPTKTSELGLRNCIV